MTQHQWSPWIKWFLALALPILLLTLNLRLVTGHWFVRWEYRRPGFPPDPYGLPTGERIRLAETCQDFLASNADISLLADLRLADGEPAFNERELRHMSDVQAVYHGISIAGIIAGLMWVGGGTASIALGQARDHLSGAFLNGSLITLGLLTLVGGFMAISWGEFFTAFHRLFFQGNTWIFPNSDTLIRLFPIRFWIDIAATLVGLLIFETIVLGAAGWATRPAAERRTSTQDG
jgi:integral membrane protein (TIGR01906 family)